MTAMFPVDLLFVSFIYKSYPLKKFQWMCPWSGKLGASVTV